MSSLSVRDNGEVFDWGAELVRRGSIPSLRQVKCYLSLHFGAKFADILQVKEACNWPQPICNFVCYHGNWEGFRHIHGGFLNLMTNNNLVINNMSLQPLKQASYFNLIKSEK